MAVYDCKYMIPYLDSLYSMELQYEKIIEEREKASEQYQKDYNIFNDIPDKPQHYKNRLYYQTYKGIILLLYLYLLE